MMKGSGVTTKTTRLYAHCGKIKDTLVLFGLNMANTTQVIPLEMTYEKLCAFNFTPITPSNEGLTSKEIQLNKRTLKLNPDSSVPNLLEYANCQVKAKNISLPPYSMGFWVLYTNPKSKDVCQV